MLRLLLAAVAIATACSASTLPPATGADRASGPPDITMGPTDDTTMGPPDITTPDMDFNVTDADNMDNVTDTAPPEVLTTVETSTNASTANCNGTLTEIQKVSDFTDGEDFKDLSENQQILVYELLAAVEDCDLTSFITAETAQRVFLLAEDLPLKYVYMFVSFLSRSLAREGIVVPV